LNVSNIIPPEMLTWWSLKCY